MNFISLFLLGIISFFPLKKHNNTNFLNLQKTKDSEISSYEYQIWNNASWQDSLRNEYFYYADSNVVIYKKFSDNNFVTDSKITYVKNADDKNIRVLKQIWDNYWINSYRYLYYYNADNNLASALYQEWVNDNWLTTYQGIYSYDESNNLTEELWQRWIDENNLENDHIFNYSYNENNDLTELTYSFWDENQNMTNSYKISYQYSDTLVTEYLYQIWESDDWQNSYKYTYEYDNNGQLINTLYYEWQRDWNNTLFASYNYDENGNISEELWQYEYLGNTYNYSRNRYSYNNSDVFENTVTLAKLSNYPNPFNPTTTISYSLPQNTKTAKIEIYNLKGQRIKQLEVMNKKSEINQVIWYGKDYSNKIVPSGVYLYKLNVNGKTKAVKKCLLLK